MEELEEKLFGKIKVLSETAWENKAKRLKIENWLDNFNSKERIGALYLLSNFMYFNSLQMKELLKAVYRDLYRYPIIEKIRKQNKDTIDHEVIENLYLEELKHTRFLGVGNPSESGPHLLYYFRQENKIPKDLFINTHEIIDIDNNANVKLKDPNIRHLVYLDDFCGSGTQAIIYSKFLSKVKKIKPNISLNYLMLFGTDTGKQNIRDKTDFDKVEAVFEFDSSFKVFNSDSRYFRNPPKEIDKQFIKEFCMKYGKSLYKSIWRLEGMSEERSEKMGNRDKLGFKDGQLLVGFQHNTPTNTLPILWYDEPQLPWKPIFKRYNKIYKKL